MNTVEATTEFHLKEYEALRVEIDGLLNEARTLERWVLLSIGPVVVWLYSHPDIPLPAGAYWVPFLLASACAVRVRHFQMNVGHAVAYSRELEQFFCSSDSPEGWNHFVDRVRHPKYSVPSVVFWCLLVGLTALFGAFH
jgi:hypothetical protein